MELCVFTYSHITELFSPSIALGALYRVCWEEGEKHNSILLRRRAHSGGPSRVFLQGTGWGGKAATPGEQPPTPASSPICASMQPPAGPPH